MKKIFFIILVIVFFSGCKTEFNDTNTTEEIKDQGVPVIISQDSYDRDNYSLITAAMQLDNQQYIDFIALTVTARDIDNKSGLIYSSLLYEGGYESVPISINHANISTRATPIGRRYPDMLGFNNDKLLDSERVDSTENLKLVLESSPNKVTYVVGGHIHNLASLLEKYPKLVEEKIEQVIFASCNADSANNAIPCMNESQGLWYPNGSGDATIFVINNLPKSVKFISTSPTDALNIEYPEINYKDYLSLDSKLRYFLDNGTYQEHYLSVGDFPALLYATTSNQWFGKQWVTLEKTCFKTTDFGGIYRTNGDCNHYTFRKVDRTLVSTILNELLKNYEDLRLENQK